MSGHPCWRRYSLCIRSPAWLSSSSSPTAAGACPGRLGAAAVACAPPMAGGAGAVDGDLLSGKPPGGGTFSAKCRRKFPGGE